MTLTGMKKRVGVLERSCTLGPRRLAQETASMEGYRQLWASRFDELDVIVEELKQMGLIDEYRLVIDPVIAGHGPTSFHGLDCPRRLELLSTHRLKSGVVAMHYRRKNA